MYAFNAQNIDDWTIKNTVFEAKQFKLLNTYITSITTNKKKETSAGNTMKEGRKEHEDRIFSMTSELLRRSALQSNTFRCFVLPHPRG